MTYSDDYTNIITRYSENPSEPSKWPTGLWYVILASVILAVILGCTDGWPTALRAITCWEIIAIANTLIFSFFYFKDLWREAIPTKWQGFRGTLLIGLGIILNLILLGFAFKALLNYDRLHQEISALQHLQEKADDGSQQSNAGDEHQERKNEDARLAWAFAGYLALVLSSFLVFAVLDLLFAFQSKVFRKVREYWLLCLFVDGPAVVAFVILLAYLLILNAFGRTVNTDILSGAVVMQMLIADTLYLVVASNLYHFLLANKLCDGVTQVGDPE